MAQHPRGIAQRTWDVPSESNPNKSYRVEEVPDTVYGAMLVLFSHLIRTGQCWSMQGAYGRRAQSLIEVGAIARDGTILYPLGLGD